MTRGSSVPCFQTAQLRYQCDPPSLQRYYKVFHRGDGITGAVQGEAGHFGVLS